MDRFDGRMDKWPNEIVFNTQNEVLYTSSFQQEKTKHWIWMRVAKNKNFGIFLLLSQVFRGDWGAWGD